jgi:predicted AAA+ superfamily ATPase
MDLNIGSLPTDLNELARGAIAEQLIGQHLLDDREMFQSPAVFYWNRQKSGTSSEIDYLTVYNDQVIPVEVKSGTVGSMKSLQMFIKLKKKKPAFALRFLSNFPENKTIVETDTGHTYQLISLPHYLVEHWRRYVDSVENNRKTE